MILNLSGKSLKSTCKEICILESFFVSMNKIFEIHLWKNTFFQFTILLVIFVIVPNVPLLKCLTLVSVNHLLENLWLFTTCIPRVWRQNNLFPLHIYFNLHIYIFMWILNTCVFVSASEIGALILYFTKLILRIQKTGKHCKYFCLLYKNFMSKQTSPPFLNNLPL